MTKNKKFGSKSEKIYIQKSRYSLKGPLKVSLVLLARGDSSFDVAIQFDRRNLEENDPSETARTKTERYCLFEIRRSLEKILFCETLAFNLL